LSIKRGHQEPNDVGWKDLRARTSVSSSSFFVFNPVALVAALFDPALTEQKTPQNPG
jgi:hypothetical protein